MESNKITYILDLYRFLGTYDVNLTEKSKGDTITLSRSMNETEALLKYSEIITRLEREYWDMTDTYTTSYLTRTYIKSKDELWLKIREQLRNI